MRERKGSNPFSTVNSALTSFQRDRPVAFRPFTTSPRSHLELEGFVELFRTKLKELIPFICKTRARDLWHHPSFIDRIQTPASPSRFTKGRKRMVTNVKLIEDPNNNRQLGSGARHANCGQPKTEQGDGKECRRQRVHARDHPTLSPLRSPYDKRRVGNWR